MHIAHRRSLFPFFRYVSVLGRIGLAWVFAALIFLHSKQTKLLFAWFVGLLPTMAVTATGLSGMLAGKLSMHDAKPMKKVVWLLLAGVVCMIIGQVWNLFFPINKNLWSSSFVCWIGGLSLLLLALCMFVHFCIILQ